MQIHADNKAIHMCPKPQRERFALIKAHNGIYPRGRKTISQLSPNKGRFRFRNRMPGFSNCYSTKYEGPWLSPSISPFPEVGIAVKDLPSALTSHGYKYDKNMRVHVRVCVCMLNLIL